MKKHYLLLLMIPLMVACATDEESMDKSPDQKSEIVANVTLSPVTGKEVDDINGTHFAVMIENSLDARPQTGLIDADIVYEIKTEGNISRYLAFYHDTIPKVIGPVRSSRHYFIPLAEEMNYPYIHFGASTFAYDYLESGLLEVPHLDGIKEGNVFSRDTTRKAPHNAYLETDKLQDYNDLRISNDHFVFHSNNMEDGTAATTIELEYNNFTHVRYSYDSNEGTYLRFQEDAPHIDRNNNTQIAVKNIIVQYTKHETIHDDKYGRINVAMDKEGTFDYFSEGKKVSGTWENRSDSNSTVYLDASGDLLSLNPGNTWIQVVDESATIVVN